MTILISIDAMGKQFWNDENIRMPFLSEFKKNGAFAEDVEVSYPSSTWISHTSIITGTNPSKHGVLGNWAIERDTGKVIEHFSDLTAKEDVVLVPTLYDIAKKAGMTTASICWPVTRDAKNLDYCIPEFYFQSQFENFVDADFWSDLKRLNLPVDSYADWSLDHGRGPMQDWLTNEISRYLITEKKPDLLMIHYLLPDSFQHDYGVGSNEARWSVNYVDSLIGDLIFTLKTENLFDKTNFFITADHGQTNVKKAISPNILFRDRGWQKEGEKQMRTDDNPPVISEETDAVCVSNGADGFVYIFKDENKESFISEVKTALMETGAVERIIDKSEFEQLGLPTGHKDSPDFIIETLDDYYVDFTQSGKLIDDSRFKGMHGFLPQKEDMKVSFLAFGPDIKKVIVKETVKSIDIAPTIAEIMGISFNDADGSVIREIFR